MRTKKLFSLLLAVLMLCSLSVSAFAAETAQASVPVVLTVVNSVSPISVSVPACLPVTVLDGYVVTASNAVIENRAQSGAVQVVAVDVQPGAFAIETLRISAAKPERSRSASTAARRSRKAS